MQGTSLGKEMSLPLETKAYRLYQSSRPPELIEGHQVHASRNHSDSAAFALALGIVVGIILTNWRGALAVAKLNGQPAQLKACQIAFRGVSAGGFEQLQTTASWISRLKRSYQDIQEPYARRDGSVAGMT